MAKTYVQSKSERLQFNAAPYRIHEQPHYSHPDVNIATLKTRYWKAITSARLLAKRQWPAWRRFVSAQLVKHSPPPTPSSRRIMLLTWEFPPQVTGGVYRPLSFARHAAASGWQVEVVCGPSASSDAGRYLADLLPESVPVNHVTADRGPHPWPLPQIDGGIVNALALYEAAAERISADESGVILASGPPFSNFVAGLWLARKTGWRLALDYRDEWTETPFSFVATDGENREWEAHCLARADLVIFTTPSQLAHAERRFDELAHNRHAVVYNGWEPGDFAAAPVVVQKDPAAPITLAYLGNLGAMAAPDAFLDTLARALATRPDLRARLKVRLVGHKRPDALDKLRSFPYPDVIELIDTVPKIDACSMMREVDGLLLLNPPGLARYIQGKLYEYIAAGTPILSFGSGGEMGEIILSLGAGMTIAKDDADGLADALLRLRDFPAVGAGARTNWLASRERAKLARTLYQELDALIAVPVTAG